VEISDFNFDTQSRPEVLIVGEMKDKELKKILNITQNQPVLIVTDVEKYFSEGPHIIFYFSDEGNIRFKFNKKTFGRTGLYVSHLLLRYAEFVE
ncbi:MAG: YfiR family protein, partial [Rhodothermaceae bacterium]